MVLPASTTALLSQEISALALDTNNPFFPSTPLHTRRSSFLTSSRPPSATIPAAEGSATAGAAHLRFPFGNDSLNMMSPLRPPPVVDLSGATVMSLRPGAAGGDSGRAAAVLTYSSEQLMRVWLPPLATSLVGRALAAVKQLLPRELALHVHGAWYSARHAPGPALAPPEEWTLFCKTLLSLAGYQVSTSFDIESLLAAMVRCGLDSYRSPKFIWAPCVQLYSLAETPQLPPAPRIWTHIRERYWSMVSQDRRYLLVTPCLDVFAFYYPWGTSTYSLDTALQTGLKCYGIFLNFRVCLNQCFGSESVSGFNQVGGSVSGFGIRIQGGKNYSQK